MIKAILFDFDGVITIDKTGSKTICNYISSVMNIDLQLFTKEYIKFNEQLLIGVINHKDIWSNLCDSVGVNIPYQVLIESFQNTKIDNRIIALIEKLKKHGYKIGMVTDNKKDRIDEIIKWYKWYGIFDRVSISSEIGSGKNRKAIFEKTIKELNVNSQECIFIDNSKDNLISPNEMGIHTVFYDDELKNIEELDNKIQEIIKKEEEM